MTEYRKAKKQIDVSVGESVRILRELQELSQNELAELTGNARYVITNNIGDLNQAELLFPELKIVKPEQLLRGE